MTEINIILDTNFEEKANNDIIINDKYIFYENLNKELHIESYNTYNQNKISYNDTLLDLIDNDNFLEQINNINNTESSIKKIIIKKILEHINPIIDYNSINTIDSLDSNTKKNIIIDKNSISLNYIIESKFIKNNKNKHLFAYIIPNNTNFLVKGLFDNNKLYNIIPYKYNPYKFYFNNKFKIYDQKISNIFNQKINYSDKTLLDLNTLSIDELKNLLNYLLSRFNTYLNNYEIQILKQNSIINYNIASNLINYNKQTKKYVDSTFNKNYITQFNHFLDNKISDYYNNNIYFAFYNNDLLDLYENILIYSIDNKAIKTKIESILEDKRQKEQYKLNQTILTKNLLVNYNLENLCRKKFPNLFNPHSKEYIFINNKFDINTLPKKYKDIILIEHNKTNKYIENYNKNDCYHKNLIYNFNNNLNKKNYFNEIVKLIDYKKTENNAMYKCLSCSFNLICPHIIEYYTLLFNNDKSYTNEFNIQQKILNKYMTNAPINMIYYCKICGEEIGKSLELEQNIEYKDKVKLNTSEYTDDTLELIKTNTNYIIRTYVSFNQLNLNITKKYLIDYITKLISFYVNQIEKKIRKIKNNTEEHILDVLNFNIIIFIYSALIFIMTKYNYIIFNPYFLKKLQPKNYIVNKRNKITGSKANTKLIELLRSRFKEAFEIIYNTNNILLKNLNYLNKDDKIKELLLKSYNLLTTNDELVISSSSFSNINTLLLNYSFIYRYLYDILNIYPIINKNNYNFSLPFFKIQRDIVNININKKLEYNNFETILNININKNPDYLFKNINIPNFNNNNKILLNDIDKINNINNYNEYKYISFLVFYYQILNNLYEQPIFEFIDYNQINKNIKSLNVYIDNIKPIINKDFVNISKLYSIYIKLLNLLKTYELELINNNYIYYLYPYSHIKLNNERYFTIKDININNYLCLNDGYKHNFNIYIFNVNNKTIECNKKDLDNFINTNKNYKFIDHKCNKCLLLKNEILKTKVTNNDIINKITLTNDINTFYNIFSNKCPLDNYHIFKNNECSICKITYEQIFKKDEKIFNKFQKQYLNYIQNKENNYNTLLSNLNQHINNRKIHNSLENIKKNINLSYNKIDKNYNNLEDYKKYIDSLKIDELYIKISKIYKIDIIYLQLLGITEGYSYNELKNINNDFNKFSNRYIKILNYIRSIFIYYNLLKNSDKINKYYDFEFYNILLEIKSVNLNNLPNYNINIIDLYNYIKIINNKEYQYVIEFGLKIIYDFILLIDDINKKKYNNNLNKFLEFIINKILKYDELFTNYDYAQLKQMFTENSPNFTLNDVYENDMSNENEEDDELFGYNDLNINFEDEEPLED